MLEIEMKFPVADFDAIQRQLADWGAGEPAARDEADHYFNAPDRDFASTDEAFRVRRIGAKNFITYKGPKRDTPTKTRAEIEVPIGDGDHAAESFINVLNKLGYRAVAVVRKHRRIYHLERGRFSLEVCLDDVERVGQYAELEILAPEEQLEEAQAVVLHTAAALGLTTSERRSYLTLLLQKGRLDGQKSPSRPALVTGIEELRQAVARVRRAGQSIGLVPTMGALHAGHASLFRAARSETKFVVASIFVNPTQFGPTEDFARYPRTLDQDLGICAETGVDLVYAPDLTTMYPPEFATVVEVPALQTHLCGLSRPTHFRGVATVVLKLFNQVVPDGAYFGQKDYQQARLVQQLVRDLDLPIEVRVCPIIREADGLALSSRNGYLDADQRRHATVLYRSLEEARKRVATGERDAARLRNLLVERITATPGATLDYAEIVDADSLQPVTELHGSILVALAVKFGATRLIDNILLKVPEAS
jgi:pantoate--beta-alanine ligase